MAQSGGRPQKLSSDIQKNIYEQKNNGQSLAFLAFTNNVSLRTIERIIKKYKEFEVIKNEK